MPSPSPWLRTFTQALTVGYNAVVVPEGVLADKLIGSATTPWTFAGDTAAPGFPVPANTPQDIDFDLKTPLYIRAALAGTFSYAILGVITAVRPGTNVLT